MEKHGFLSTLAHVELRRSTIGVLSTSTIGLRCTEGEESVLNNIDLSDFSSLQPVHVDDLVRLGPRRDGGYVVPKRAVDATRKLVSYGVSTSWAFEEDFLEANPKIHIDCYDHSVGPSIFLRRLLSGKRFSNGTFQFVMYAKVLVKYMLFFGLNSHIKHFRKKITSATSRGEISAAETIGDQSNVFLKVDIEGSEYEIVSQLVAKADQILCIAIEFHELGENKEGFLRAVQALRERYNLVHFHVNNFSSQAEGPLPQFAELTFLSKQFSVSDERREGLPLPQLDFPNNPKLPDPSVLFGPPSEPHDALM